VQLESPPGFIAATGQVAAFVNHFSLFTVLSTAKTESPANIILEDITLSRDSIRPGETVTIKAKLTNTGGLSGEYVLKIGISDLLDTTRLVRVAPGETEEVQINVAPIMPGDYAVEIGNLRGTFRVEKAPVEPQMFLYWLYLSVILVIVAGGALYIIIYLKARKNK
jgi:hypothetical protein